MIKNERILAIQKDHNSAACFFIGSQLIYYNQEERLSRIKKDSGLPIKTLQEICKISEEIDLLLVSGYDYNHGELLSIVSIIQKLGFKLSSNFKYKSYYKSHHQMHASRAFYNSGFENAMVVVWDGKGSSYNLSNGQRAEESTSIFSISKKDEFKLIYRRFFTTSEIDNSTSIVWNNEFGLRKIPKPRYVTNDTVIEIRNDFDLGFMYEGSSRSMGLNDEGGKMMSLQSFGVFDEKIPPVLENDKYFNMKVFKFNYLDLHEGFDYLKNPELRTEEGKINFSHMVQKAVEKIGLNLIKENLEKTGHTNLILTGGVALNVVANYYFRKNLPKNINIFIEPICGDEGNCLGIVDYYLREKDLLSEERKNDSIYICGNNPVYNYSLLEKEKEIENATPEIVSELIRSGHIISIFQGKAEAGPRALGNRSLLFDPRIKNGKDIVNLIKRREHFRPFAASVMLEHAHNWFDLENISESPFMMYAVNAKENIKELIPAVLHVDGTCRIQTVTKNQNDILYQIINSFYQKTGIPLILNTSFNLAGDPIVETIEDALESLRKSQLEYLYLPDIKKLIYIPN